MIFHSTPLVSLSILITLTTAWLPSERLQTAIHHSSLCPARTPHSEQGLFPSEPSACPQDPTATWYPHSKLRGVNLGSLFIIEPWMAWDAWRSLGCSSERSEFDCMSKLGQTAGNTAFAGHWSSWINHNDILEIASLGLNTIRIPVGYWMLERIVYRDSEHFAEGGLGYLERVVGWAADAGLYVIIDLHGSPGAQVEKNAFTGQFAPEPGFYKKHQFERAYEFLQWMANLIHTNRAYRNVGALEIINEPVRLWEHPDMCASLTSTFYPTAWHRIRETEESLGVPAHDRLHIVMMNEKWGSGDPKANLPDLWHAMYDDHRYIKWTSTGKTRGEYLAASCYDDRGGNWPTFVGEWSLSVADDVEWNDVFGLTAPGALAWYRKWWAAQVIAYERQAGWVFWTWKANWIAGRNDWRWSYQAAVAAGAIPRDPEEAYRMGACDGV